MLKGREWLNQSWIPWILGLQLNQPQLSLEFWPVRFCPWDISSEVQNCSREFVDNQCQYPRVDIILPIMKGSEAKSYFIMEQLLGTLNRSTFLD
jgi:hypothetical protein